MEVEVLTEEVRDHLPHSKIEDRNTRGKVRTKMVKRVKKVERNKTDLRDINVEIEKVQLEKSKKLMKIPITLSITMPQDLNSKELRSLLKLKYLK